MRTTRRLPVAEKGVESCRVSRMFTASRSLNRSQAEPGRAERVVRFCLLTG